MSGRSSSTCTTVTRRSRSRAFDLSVHTVDDHLKAIFRKTGAAGRDELMAAINA